MSSEKRHKVIEIVIYLVLWILVFAVPVVSLAIRSSDGYIGFSWREVLRMWLAIVPFFVLFLVHNFFVSKYFFIKGKRWLYFVMVAILLAVHPGIETMSHGKVPWSYHPDGEPPMELSGEGPRDAMPKGNPHYAMPDNPPHGAVPDAPVRQKIHPAPDSENHGRPPGTPFGRRLFLPDDPIDLFGISKFALAIMMLALNLVIKWFYKSQMMEEKVVELEGEMLRGQLQQLRYQINPHFFMNTLNNIHALVDIDPEKAKNTIIELSQMMRYVLYDSSEGMVTLEKEKSFLEKYLSIMSLRYSDKVTIKADFDIEGKSAMLPALLLVTFLENAFKHGITYKKESVLDTSLRMEDGRILFSCYNIKRDEDSSQKGGIGLENVKKRLNLIYGAEYNLDIAEDEESYRVNLSLPAEPKLELYGQQTDNLYRDR